MRKTTQYRLIVSLVLFGFAGCGSGAMHIRKGDRLKSKGALLEARAEYKMALNKDPSNDDYKTALDAIDSDIEERAADAVADAKAMQRKGQWLAAAEKYDVAAKYKPYDSDLKAHRALSELKSKSLDTMGWYQGLLTLAGELSDSHIVKKALKKAKVKAYQEQMGAGRMYLDEGKGTASHKAFLRAKEIDSTLPGVDQTALDKAEALHLTEQADAHWDKGDAVSAYEAYQAAYEKMAMPEIKIKMQKAKNKASRIISLIAQARSNFDKGRYAAAVSVYDRLQKMDGVPSSVKESKDKAVAKLIETLLDGAEQDIDRERLSAARKKIQTSLKYSPINAAGKTGLTEAIKSLAKNDPGQALSHIERSGLSRDERIVVVIDALAKASAESILAAAKKLPKRRASQALSMLSSLTPFMDEMPEIKSLRRSLFKASFSSMLQEAERQAKRGNDSEAADILLEAVDATSAKAPAEMQEPMREGCADLKAKKYIQAEKNFDQALAAAPRSRIAKTALKLARTRKNVAERDALSTVKSGRGNLEQAVLVLEGLRVAAPGTRSVRQAADALLAKLKRLGERGADRNLAEVIAYLGRLEEISSEARTSIASGAEAMKNGQYKKAENLFKKAEDLAVESGSAPIGRKVARAKWLASIETKFTKAPAETEEGAKALAELLAVAPDHKGGQAALKKLLEKAKAASKAQDDSAASRYLGLATIATSPDQSIAAHLGSGHESLAAGDMNTAERSYRAALKIDVDQPVARTGREIARGNRSSILTSAVDEALEGRGLQQLKAALKRSWEADAEDSDLVDAIDELLAAAEKKISIGLTGEALSLLSCVNELTADAALKAELETANTLLSKGLYSEAAVTFNKHAAKSKLAASGAKIALAQDKTRLLAGVKKLQSGDDLNLGARLTAELLALEPSNTAALEAIQATLNRAGAAAQKGKADVVIRELNAANKASGGNQEVDAAIALLDGKKYAEASSAFGGISSDLGKRGAEYSRQLRTLRLRAGMNQDDSTAAESIRALLAENPSDKQALRNLRKLLDKAKGLARKGELDKAASVFTAAVLASGAPEDLADKIRGALGRLSEKKSADAERALAELLKVAKDSQVIQAAYQSAKADRKKVQTASSRAITKGNDVVGNAKTLLSTLVADPSARLLKSTVNSLYGQARKLTRQGKDAQTAERLLALAHLEQLASDKFEEVKAATELMAGSKLEEAEAAFEKVNAEEQENPVKLAKFGQGLARERRVARTKTDLAAAEKSGQVIKASRIATELLKLAPKDRFAISTGRKYYKRVIQHRLTAAAAQKKLGKLGAAHLYLSRILKIDAKHNSAKRQLQAVEEELQKRLDFIVLIEKVARDMQLDNSHCKKIEGWMREELIAQGAKNESLGLYVIPPDWTPAVDNKEADAPTPGGGIVIKIKKCMHGQSTGTATVDWALLVPQGGKAVIEGTLSASIPKGVMPKDEQDEEGVNARKHLARSVAKSIVKKLENERTAIDFWLMTLAEHWAENKKAAQAADAFARGLVKAPKSFDPDRSAKVEAYLAEAFE